MIALLLAGFILYLYAPHLLFKFAAVERYDFVTRKEVPQIEEFFAAGLPSVFLNGITWVALRVSMLRIAFDRRVLGTVFTKDPDLHAYIERADLWPLFTYLGALYFISCISGWLYGNSLRVIALGGGPSAYAGKGRFWVRAVVLIYRRMWRPFYQQYEQPLYPQILQNSLAFVHTTQGLYHGILYAADKQRNGEIDGITLLNVSRFSRKKEQDCIEAGENPIRSLAGPLYIRWSEVLDINYPPNAGVLAKKQSEYETKIKEHQSKRMKRRRAVAKLRKASRGKPTRGKPKRS